MCDRKSYNSILLRQNCDSQNWNTDYYDKKSKLRKVQIIREKDNCDSWNDNSETKSPYYDVIMR